MVVFSHYIAFAFFYVVFIIDLHLAEMLALSKDSRLRLLRNSL